MSGPKAESAGVLEELTVPAPLLPRVGAAPLSSPAERRAASAELSVPEFAVELLERRGIVGLDAQRRALAARLDTLRPPTKMAGFEAAIERLTRAVERGERLAVFGDYDVDGVTTTTILSRFLEGVGCEVIARAARREDGYGFSPRVAEQLAASGVSLVVTGDCGTSDHEAIDLLGQRGIDVIVIDHHQVPERRPAVAALLNPWQEGCEFPFKGMCSAGVAFYLCAALRSHLRRREPSRAIADPRELLDLVALGTVCDMVPLLDENRVLVRHGLAVLSRRERPGVRALLNRAGVEAGAHIDESDLGFRLGPRINAPGRLHGAQPALDLLRASSAAEAEGLASGVESANAQRRELTTATVAGAHAQLGARPQLKDDAAIVIWEASWLPGVVGIVAAQLATHYRRPVLALGFDAASEVWRGSARSYGEIDVHAALAACVPHVQRFGGHRAAAGVSVATSGLDAMRAAFVEAVAAQNMGQGEGGVVLYDAEVLDPTVALARADWVTQVRAIGPFGVGFPAPTLLWPDAEVVAIRRFGKLREHLELRLRGGGVEVEAIGFGRGALAVSARDRVCLLGTPELSTFRGRTKVSLRIEGVWSASRS